MHVLFAILILCFMIAIHEYGHFLAGRLTNVPVYEFSIGFGPAIFKKQGKRETLYSIRAIPFGGFCAFDKGDHVGIADSALNQIPVWKKIVIAIAGPLMNILLGLLIAISLYAFIGRPKPIPTIASFAENLPAQAVLQVDDTIIEVNGIEVGNDTSIIGNEIQKGQPIELTYIRNNQTEHTSIQPVVQEDGSYLIGITYKTQNETIPFFQAIKEGSVFTVKSMGLVFEAIGGLFSGKYSIKDLSSVVGIVKVMSDNAQTDSLYVFVALCAYITINLGVMNLLPIPGLDGSKILSGLYTAITKKQFPPKLAEKLITVSMIILLGLTVILMIKDIFGLF